VPTKINHVAILSENYALSGDFYQWVFGLRAASDAGPRRAGMVGDGYVGLNINPRSAGRPARLDHFGVEVDDITETCRRLREDYPEVKWVGRPANRPFAATTTHDPDGNVFDLSQRSKPNRRDIYAEEARPLTPRHFHHLALRALHPEPLAAFYHTMFGFSLEPKANGDENAYLSDGHLTLVIMPWRITDFAGTGIVSPGLDHIGFEVESLDTFKSDVEELSITSPRLRPFPFGLSPESKRRMELAQTSCPLCVHHLADVDGVLLSVREAA
jgi:catechol 2,3-dioxygenase-like lactoylglutathione lyase family enzyme